MKVLIIIDSMKGSLSSLEAGEAAAEGIRRADPGAGVAVRALADGGEGTVQALVSNRNGKIRKIQVTGPLGLPEICGRDRRKRHQRRRRRNAAGSGLWFSR